MEILSTLEEAIKQKKTVSFNYDKEGKAKGKRIGNPHAIFILTAKNTRIQSTKVHIVQTGGVSDTNPPDFPSFRMFNIQDLSNIEIHQDQPQFDIDKKYNPEWEGYKDIIIKI